MKRVEIVIRIPSPFAEGLVEVICKLAELVGGGAYAVIVDEEEAHEQEQAPEQVPDGA